MAQKPLELIARDIYGGKRFEYPFFATKPGASKFKSLLLRNGGADASSNDWSQTMVREPSAHLLMAGDPEDIAVDYQGYQPVVVYLNCGYYGIHQLREKVNQYFAESNYGIDPDGVNFYKPTDQMVSHGSGTFQGIEQALAGVAAPDRWDYLHSGAAGVDYNEYISYQAAERYLNNTDWPGNNTALWQPGGGDYRWVLWDLDGGFGTGAVHLTFATNPFFAKVMASPEALDDFGQHVAARASITFRSQAAIGVVDGMAAAIAAEMANPANESDPLYHIGRWKTSGGIQSLAAWQTSLQPHQLRDRDDRRKLPGDSVAEDTEDWVELFNNTGTQINLSGGVFKDGDGNFFTIPSGTMIESFGFLILCRDAAKFAQNVGGPPWVNPNCLDWGSFGLSDDDSLTLTVVDPDLGIITQHVDNSSAAPWAVQPAPGYSLQFLPLSGGGWPTNEANGLAENWFYPSYNTPGWIFH